MGLLLSKKSEKVKKKKKKSPSHAKRNAHSSGVSPNLASIALTEVSFNVFISLQ
jgi:hypothetical protein